MTCRIRVCRDCCCGTTRKHPEVDHDGLVDALVSGTRGHAAVSVTGCLLACELSNVVVVSPGAGARRGSARPVWFKEVLDLATVDAIAAWVRRGGPGLVGLPSALAGHETPVPALARAAGGSG